MKSKLYILFIFPFFFACKSKVETLSPTMEQISESVYASGFIKSHDQYQVFTLGSGIITEVVVNEGDVVKKNQLLFKISNEIQELNKRNAELNASYSDLQNNLSKLNDLKLNVDLAKIKMLNDSINWIRQKNLFSKNAISSSQLEQSELVYQNSKTNYQSSIFKYNDLKKQLNLSDQQSKNNLLISQKNENDYLIKSDIKGRVYSVLKEKGDMVSPQTPLAIIGDASTFLLEMQVDEYDIIKIKKGQKIIVTLDSYKGETFEAIVTKIDPIMNERSKTFTIEGQFTKAPKVLYPNLSLQANILIRTKQQALTIPRSYIIDEQYVLLEDGTKRKVKIGLKDYQVVEIVSGLSKTDKLVIPIK